MKDCFGGLKYRSMYPEEPHVYVWKSVPVENPDAWDKFFGIKNKLVKDREINYEECRSCNERHKCRLGKKEEAK